MSIQGLQQNPQDTSNFYLANLYKASIADLNRSNTSVSFPASPPLFSPPAYAIWVNSLWFLSLVISVTCALLATLLQQWARRYLKVTQTRSSLHKRARIRSFFAEGVGNSNLSNMVELLPTLIHVSVSLFFAGLVVFLWNVNLTIVKVVLSWIGLCTIFYGYTMLVPIFRHSTPYRSPLAPLAVPVVFVLLYVLLLLYFGAYILVLVCGMCVNCRRLILIFGHLSDWVIKTQKTILLVTPEMAALKLSSEIDARALIWTLDRLDEDHELERFFSGIPGFHYSKVVKEPLRGLDKQQRLRLLEAVIRLLDRTFSSNLLPDQVKRHRADICANVIDLLDIPRAFPEIVRRLGCEGLYGPTQSTEIVDFVKRCRWAVREGEDTTLVQAMFSILVARVQRHDDSWFKLASEELGIPERDLRRHARHGASLSLVILIYVTRQQFIHIRNPLWPSYEMSDVLRAASNFDVQDTSPELQHEFCALWNQMVQATWNNIPLRILAPIRNLYFALHQGTNSAATRFSPSTGDDNLNLAMTSVYPLCKVFGHIHHSSAPTMFPPIDVDNSFTTVPFPNNSYPTRHTIEPFRLPVTSANQPSAGTMRDSVSKNLKSKRQKRDVVTTAPQPAPEASAISYPPSPITPIAALIRPNDIPRTSRVPRTPAPASSTPVLDNTHHTGLSLFFLLPQLHLTAPLHRLIIVTTRHPPPSANRATRANNPTTLDPQALPPSITDPEGAIPSRPVREPNVGRTGGRRHSHRRYDIV